MPEAIFRHRRSAHAATLALLAAPGLLLFGCSLPKPPPETSGAAYSGPPVTMGTRVDRHTAIFECPSPGWRVQLDQVRDAPEGWTHAFVSVYTPSPLFVYAQVVTSQEVALNIGVDRPTRVYARVLGHDGQGSMQYHRAAESDKPSAPAPK